MHKPIKFVEKGLSIAANGAWVVFNGLNKIKQRPSFTPKWSDQAASEVVREDEAAARLAARDRLAVPDLHARGTAGDSRRQEGRQRAAEREGRRDQGDDSRARRQDPDGEGLPHSRPFRGRDGDRHRRSSSISRMSSRAATSAPTATRSCTTTAAARSSTDAARCSPST